MGLDHSKVRSFGYAIAGFKEALRKEPNLRIHIFIAALTILAAILLSFSLNEWLILLITIFFVLTLELINTAIESLVNMVSPEIKSEAKIAKDVSASAVLMGAILAIIVGIILFFPKLLSLLK